MGRIGTTISGIERSLLNRLAEANAATTLSALRVATGQNINTPSDNPSGFVRLSGLQSRLGDVRATMSNVTAASSMITQMQTTLGSLQTELDSIRTQLLLDEDRSNPLSTADRAAAQAKIDTAINQINSLASQEIDGRKLLDGSANFTVSGLNSAQVSDLVVHATASSIIPDGSPPTQAVSGEVLQAATRASLVYTGNMANQVTADATFTLTGDFGSASISVTNLETLSSVATKVNDETYKTGVTATFDPATHTLTFSSVNYGTDAHVALVVTAQGPFAVTGGNGDATANGTNATAEINGQTYNGATYGPTNGSRFTINEGGFRYEIEFEAGFTGTFDPFTVSGEALTFALSDDINHRATLAIPGVGAAQLGGLSGTLAQLASGGTLSLASLNAAGKNSSEAIQVVDEALAELTRIEGSVDGFFNAAITSSSGLLSDLEDDLEVAIDEINLVDATQEATQQAYYQDLAANAVAGLSILREQRSSIVNMIQAIAGLT